MKTAVNRMENLLLSIHPSVCFFGISETLFLPVACSDLLYLFRYWMAVGSPPSSCDGRHVHQPRRPDRSVAADLRDRWSPDPSCAEEMAGPSAPSFRHDDAAVRHHRILFRTGSGNFIPSPLVELFGHAF